MRHRISTMAGRDPNETGRTATSLELFFDLTFVVAFSFSGVELAHALTEGHFYAGIVGFLFCAFAAVWAWINYSWFASAFATDDWLFRVATLAQMFGVIVLAIGVKPVFTSLEHGGKIDNRILVLGFVIMRSALIFQWLRAAYQSPEYRINCLSYAGVLIVAQIGWVLTALLDMSHTATFIWVAGLWLVELSGPFISETLGAKKSTPWHVEHITERYSLLVIITLGEGIIGTVAAIRSAITIFGWTTETIVLGLACILITFGVWWTYFLVPFAEGLGKNRITNFIFGYLHIVLFVAVASLGGLFELAAKYVEHHAHVSALTVMTAVATPLIIYVLILFTMYGSIFGFDKYHLPIASGALLILALSVFVVAKGASLIVGLVIAALAFLVIILWDESRDREYLPTPER